MVLDGPDAIGKHPIISIVHIYDAASKSINNFAHQVNIQQTAGAHLNLLAELRVIDLRCHLLWQRVLRDI